MAFPSGSQQAAIQVGHVIKPGEKIFISAAKAIPTDYLSKASCVVQELNLVPIVYRGISRRGGGLTNNVYREAEHEFTQCRAIVILTRELSEGNLDDDWAFDVFHHFVNSVGFGIVFAFRHAYGDSRDIGPSFDVDTDSSVRTRLRVVATPDDFLQVLRQAIQPLILVRNQILDSASGQL